MSEPSSLEIVFLRVWTQVTQDRWPAPKREFRFHPTRQWRFDFAWERERVAVELEGGAMSWPVVCDSCGRNVCRTVSYINKRGEPTKRKDRVYAAMGRHTRSAGVQADCDKYNAAEALGWHVLRYTTKHLTESPVQMIEQIQSLLAQGPQAETQGDLFEPVMRQTTNPKKRRQVR